MTVPITGNLKETQRFPMPIPEGAAGRPGMAGKPEDWIRQKVDALFFEILKG